MPVTRFEDLECWKMAKSLAVELYKASNTGEFSKDFGFKDQVRRAAVSIASNIAEGKERETVAEFIRYLYIAKGSAGELRTQLLIAQDIGYLDKESSNDFRTKVEALSAMIGALIKRLKGQR
ncbi:MAG: four helix bundle protein [Nitrospira sp.]|nr:four helix bundle protein [Nitrospira sp.]